MYSSAFEEQVIKDYSIKNKETELGQILNVYLKHQDELHKLEYELYLLHGTIPPINITLESAFQKQIITKEERNMLRSINTVVEKELDNESRSNAFVWVILLLGIIVYTLYLIGSHV